MFTSDFSRLIIFICSSCISSLKAEVVPSTISSPSVSTCLNTSLAGASTLVSVIVINVGLLCKDLWYSTACCILPFLWSKLQCHWMARGDLHNRIPKGFLHICLGSGPSGPFLSYQGTFQGRVSGFQSCHLSLYHPFWCFSGWAVQFESCPQAASQFSQETFKAGLEAEEGIVQASISVFNVAAAESHHLWRLLATMLKELTNLLIWRSISGIVGLVNLIVLWGREGHAIFLGLFD